MLRRAFHHSDGSYNERDFLTALLLGHWRLWAYGTRAICITEVLQLPRLRKLLIRCISGDWGAFESNIPLLEQYARDQGCQVIEAYARKGLMKALPDWSVRHVYMVKEL